MFNIEKKINKTLCCYVILVIIATTCGVIVFPRMAGIIYILCSLIYLITEIISLWITKYKIKKQIPFDYNIDPKEQLTKAYKNTRLLSICNYMFVITAMIILVIYQIMQEDYDTLAVPFVTVGVGLFALIKLARAE